MAYDGSIKFDTKVDKKGFDEGIKGLGSAAKAGAKVAAAAIAGISVAFVGAGVAAVKFGSEFESSVAKASTLFGEVQVDVDGLKDKMIGLSNSTGIAASELGNSLYNALSAGIPVTEDMGASLAYMEDCTKLAKAGFTDVDTAVTATAKVLNAYKMDVSETGDVHKVLMQVQNKGITTVGELGSVLAQVTPTAAAMNVAFEQVGASLATMTAQGTPAAQATTQLNSMFAELGKSGMQAQKMLVAAAEGTQYAGMSFQGMMQKGVPLNEVLGLMDEYAKKNNKSLLDMFGSIEAGKAALAMSGQNAAQYASNLEAMGTSADVVGDAYEKVTDTLEAKTQEMGNSFKNLGIQVYEKFETPLKEGVKVAIGSLSGLSSELNSGKLSGSLDKIAASTGQFLGKAAELASQVIPKLVNGLSFVIDHGRQITAVVGAATAAVVTFKAVSVLGSIVKSWQAAAVVVKSYTVAMAANNAVSVTGRTVGILLASTMTAQQIVVGVLTGKVTFATAAQVAWNAAMAANPIGLVIAGVAALTVGIGILASKESEEEIQSKELTESIRDRSESWKELKKSQEEQIESAVAEIDHTKALWEELQNLVDENGNVVGSKERVKAITEEINELMPGAISWIDEERIAYNEGAAAIENMITMKKAEAVLSASEEGYKEALKEQNDALMESAKIKLEIDNIEAQIAEKQAQREDVKGARARNNYSLEIMALKENLEEKKELYLGAEGAFEGHVAQIEYYESLRNAISSGNYAEMNRLISEFGQSYKTAANSSKEGLEAQLEVQTAMLEILKAELKKGTPGITQEMIRSMDSAIAATKVEIGIKTPVLGEAMTTGTSAGITSSGWKVSSALMTIANKAVADAKKSIESNSPSKLTKRVLGIPMGEGVAVGVLSEQEHVSEAITRTINNAIGRAVKAVEKTIKIGAAAAEGLAKGIESKSSQVYKITEEISKKALETAKEKAKSYKEVGKLYADSLTKGMNERAEKSIEATKKMVEGNVAALAKANPKAKAQFEKDGRAIIDAYTKAIKEGSTAAVKQVGESIQAICDEAQTKYDAIIKQKESMQNKLSDYGELFIIEDGMLSIEKIDNQTSAIERYDKALTTLKEKGVSDAFISQVTALGVDEGTLFAEKLLEQSETDFDNYVKKWEEKQVFAKAVAEKFYKDQLDTLETEFSGKLTVSLAEVPSTVEGIGKNAMQGFINGMESMLSAATGSASNIANQVIKAYQDAFEIRSPSKKTERLIGKPLGQGISLGAKKEIDRMYERMKQSVDFEMGKISSRVTVSANHEASTKQVVNTKEYHNTAKVIEKTTQLEFKGNLAAVGRTLRPVIVGESVRKGKSFTDKGGI